MLTEACAAASGGTVLTLETLASIKAANDNAIALKAAAAILVFFVIEKSANARPLVKDPEPAMLAPSSEIDPPGPFTNWQAVKFRGKALRSMAQVTALSAPVP